MDAERRQELRSDAEDIFVCADHIDDNELLWLLDAADERDAVVEAARVALATMERKDAGWYIRNIGSGKCDAALDALAAALGKVSKSTEAAASEGE